MEIPAYPYLRFFGLVNHDAASPFAAQCIEYIQAVRDALTSDDLAVVLDQCHATYLVRCHALDMIVHQHAGDDEATREELAIKVSICFIKG